jgi:CheY-like chemotaxis protein
MAHAFSVTTRRAEPKRAECSQARVLLVDDEPVLRRSVARLLRQAGYDVVVAADGTEALLRYRASPQPQVVILDLDMPVIDGEATCRKLFEINPRARVLFVTGHDVESCAPRLLKLGAADVLAKPYPGSALIAGIEAALAAVPSIVPGEEDYTLQG